MRPPSLLILLILMACTEPNPSYDPDFVPPCRAGELRCENTSQLFICAPDESGANVWTLQKTCWSGTVCDTAWCAPDNAPACGLPSDCTRAGDVCTVLISDEKLENHCIPAPNPQGREPGRACARHEDCQSGWCFRRTCYHPCAVSQDCPFSEECVDLNVTVDHIQGAIRGCASL